MKATHVTRQELLRRIVDRLPAIVTEEYGQLTTCIPASYHAFETLRALGIPARLASMDTIAMNLPFVGWLEAKETDPALPMPEGAWSVGVTHTNPDKDGYCSHLVARTKGVILDCAAGQLSRPQHDMPVPPGIMLKGGLWQSAATIVSYRPSPEPVPPMWVLDPEATRRTRARINEEIVATRYAS